MATARLLIAAMGTMIAVFATIADISGLIGYGGILPIAAMFVGLLLAMSVVFRRAIRNRLKENTEK